MNAQEQSTSEDVLREVFKLALSRYRSAPQSADTVLLLAAACRYGVCLSADAKHLLGSLVREVLEQARELPSAQSVPVEILDECFAVFGKEQLTLQVPPLPRVLCGRRVIDGVRMCYN